MVTGTDVVKRTTDAGEHEQWEVTNAVAVACKHASFNRLCPTPVPTPLPYPPT